MSVPVNNLLTSFSDRFSLEGVRSNINNVKGLMSNLRPPQEFFDFRRLSKPANFGEVQSRVSYNLGYFSSNYLVAVAVLSTYALITNLLLLFVLLLVVGGVYGINKLEGEDLVLPIGRFNTSQLYTGLLVVALPISFLASPISTMMWLIGSSGFIILAHASFMDKPIETVFEEV